MNDSWYLMARVVGLFVTWLALDATVGAEEMQRVVEVWQQRKSQVSSWSVTWMGSETPNPTSDVDGARPTTYSVDRELTLAGHSNLRCKYRRNGVLSAGGKFHRVDLTFAFDGHSAMDLKRWESTGFTEGAIYTPKKQRAAFLRDVELKPIVMCLRPLDEHAGGFRRENLRMSKRKGMIGKRNIPIIEEANTDGEIWVDPERDFIVVKYATPRLEVSIDYSRYATGIWLPSDWRTSVTAGSEFKDKVVRWEINANVKPEDLNISFPRESLIHDRRESSRRIIFIDESGHESELTKKDAMERYHSSMSEIFPSLSNVHVK